MADQDLISSIKEGEYLDDHLSSIRALLIKKPKSIVILDDDPTGTQTVHGVPVITQWSEEVLESELLASPVFFILTNSRSLQAEAAENLGKVLGERLQKLAQKHHKNLIVISRSDSTLRGHYPNEVNALAKGLGWHKAKHLLIPAFFEGGRYTFHDIHYVKEGNAFIPAAQTPFSRDNTFGYSNSDLKDWIVEKTGEEVKREQIASLSIEQLRRGSTASIQQVLLAPSSSHIVVNATCNSDLQNLALACLQANADFVFRTGASFVNAISGIAPRPCLSKFQILADNTEGGGLVVIGSYVPKTTAQLNYLKASSDAVIFELDASKVHDAERFLSEVESLVKKVDQNIADHKDVVVHTSRTIIKGTSKTESLEIVNRISNGLVSLVKKLNNRPKYILAKGGITSSDIATKALSVSRASVMGQVLKGIPVWKLGPESKFPDIPYIVFPGNVGDETAIQSVLKLLK